MKQKGFTKKNQLQEDKSLKSKEFMVRINIIYPENLADQHLIAEYNEILMLFGYIKKYPRIYPEKIPKNYCLGKGHILFFKDKQNYLVKRFGLIKEEMKRRGFKTQKKIPFVKNSKKWLPSERDKEIIKKRLIEKINLKPDYYRYFGEKKENKYFINLIKNAE